MDERRLRRGSGPPYHWPTSTDDYIGTLLRLCPEIVLGRHLAVTSIDSGIRRLSQGWKSRMDIAYSPPVQSVGSLQFQVDGDDYSGYDEWYVFEAPADLGRIFRGNFFTDEFRPASGQMAVFVNTFAFVLHDPGPLSQTLRDLFWIQIDWIQPRIVYRRWAGLPDFRQPEPDARGHIAFTAVIRASLCGVSHQSRAYISLDPSHP